MTNSDPSPLLAQSKYLRFAWFDRCGSPTRLSAGRSSTLNQVWSRVATTSPPIPLPPPGGAWT